jgi:hypothetical protein
VESIDRRDCAGKVNGPAELHELVERFVRDLPLYPFVGFNEAQGRIDFINPLLALHGLDIQNRQGLPKAYREVVYEDRVTDHQNTPPPLRALRVPGRRREL